MLHYYPSTYGLAPLYFPQRSGGVDPFDGFTLRLQTHDGDNVPLGLWQDVAMTIPATADFDPVAAWSDELSASGLVLTQADPDKQPLLVFDGSEPTLSFDGIDDYLEASDNAAVSMGADVDFTVAARIMPDISAITISASKSVVAKGGLNGNEEWLINVFGSGAGTANLRAMVGDGGTNKLFESQALTSLAWQTCWLWLDTVVDNIGLALDSGAGATDSTTAFAQDAANPFRVGTMTNFGGLGFYYLGQISHILIVKRALTQAERTAVQAEIG